MKKATTVTLCLLVCACSSSSKKDNDFMNITYKANTMLEFRCVTENLPEPSTDAETVFKYARWLQRNNQIKRDDKVDREVERLYRIAAENDNFKAYVNLQNGRMTGRFNIKWNEQLRFAQRLINAKVATGYYFVGFFLEEGVAGLAQDTEMALRYYRKAADEGSALAQYLVGTKLRPYNVAPDVGYAMLRCAAHQGHAEAALDLAIHLQGQRLYKDALEMFQLSIAAGDETAAYALASGFEGPAPSNELDYLGLDKDSERVKRYAAISTTLAGYSYANPTVPEINDIVPLPPAELPEWDGKLQWVEDRIANIPPEKPSEALIHKLAREKVLDPATGRPLPGSPALSEASSPLMECLSGDSCPATGYWERFTNDREAHIRFFEEGDVMPTYKTSWVQRRVWPLPDKTKQRAEIVRWVFLG